MPFSCNLHGACEEDGYGFYPTQVECQTNCQPLDSDLIDDLVYDILTLNLDDAIFLAPSDIAIVLFRSTGLRVNPRRARDVLISILDKNYIGMWNMGEKVREYLRPSLDELDLLILNTVGHGILLAVQPEWTAVRNSVDRELKLMFREHPMATVTDRLEDGLPEEEVPSSLNELTNLLRMYIADTIFDAVFGEDQQFSANGQRPNELDDWEYVVRTYGPVIPYQRYIAREEQ
jgi:hypothetical protein